MTNPIKGDDMPTLKGLLQNEVVSSAAEHWYYLGVELFDDNHRHICTLDSIKRNNTDCKMRCTEMLKGWLNTDPKASWNKLIEALNSPSVNLSTVADKLKKKITGSLDTLTASSESTYFMDDTTERHFGISSLGCVSSDISATGYRNTNEHILASARLNTAAAATSTGSFGVYSMLQGNSTIETHSVLSTDDSVQIYQPRRPQHDSQGSNHEELDASTMLPREERDDTEEAIHHSAKSTNTAIQCGMTIPEVLRDACQTSPDTKAMCWEKMGCKKSITYSGYWRESYCVSKSLLKLGLKDGHAVGIMGSNSVEWVETFIGAICAGGLPVGLYTTDSPEVCCHILEICKANIVVVENQEQLDKILKIRDRLPHLKAIVLYKGNLRSDHDYPDTNTWEKFLKLGEYTVDSVIDDIIKRQKPDQCAALVQTSGTSGSSTRKLVQLSHGNFTWTIEGIIKTQNSTHHKLRFRGKERSVCFLPLAHIAGMDSSIILPMYLQSTVHFLSPECMKGPKLIEALKKVKPTFFFGVPRIWDAIKEKFEVNSSHLLRTFITLLLSGPALVFKPLLARPLIKKVKKELGLHKCIHVIAGGAPMNEETHKFFENLDIPIMGLYGMTECTGVQTINSKSATRKHIRSCGKSLQGVETKINNPNKYGEGEILLRGRNLCLGYLLRKEETTKITDEIGWLHTGDIGRIEDDFLYVKGRKSEMIRLANNEEIHPVEIEDSIKNALPFLSNVMLVGDGRECLKCLMTLKCEIEDRKATDDLQPQVINKFKKLGCDCTKVSQVIQTRSKREIIDKEIIKCLIDHSHTCSRNAEMVRGFMLLEPDFTILGGELGPTLKLKREAVRRKYEAEIDSLYR